MTISSAFVLVGLSIGCLLASRSLIHFFQLESYQFPGYFRTLKRNALKVILPGLLMLLFMCGSAILLAFILPDDEINDRFALRCGIMTGVMILLGFLVRWVFKNKNAKKPLVYTPRVKRLYAVSFVVYSVILYGLISLGLADRTGNLGNILPSILFPLLLPLWVALSGLLAWPIEKLISEMYFQDAKRILKNRPDLIKIGITGSWGKTSVKFILGTLLQEKYHTLVTPASFNTPMGVTRVIRTMLEPGHRVFVAEMGARHVGDIKEMCRLVGPTYGVLTSVGPQHLDTFHTLENIKKTKYELMNAVPENGVCFFGDDGGICRELYMQTGKERYLAGTHKELDDVWAEDITVSASGSSFYLCSRSERFLCHTRLLGILNIQNITLAASVCLKLGMTMKQIAHGITRLEPVEHRMQLISRPGCMTVIDDAFNSNIRGAKSAMEVLKGFPTKRIVVTPGMVELGKEEKELNLELGEKIAECVDVAILVGQKHTDPIRTGLVNKEFPINNIHIVKSLQEATELLNRIAGPGDTVLFENDLPDNYSE